MMKESDGGKRRLTEEKEGRKDDMGWGGIRG